MGDYQKKINIFAKNHIDPISELELKKTCQNRKLELFHHANGHLAGISKNKDKNIIIEYN